MRRAEKGNGRAFWDRSTGREQSTIPFCGRGKDSRAQAREVLLLAERNAPPPQKNEKKLRTF